MLMDNRKAEKLGVYVAQMPYMMQHPLPRRVPGKGSKMEAPREVTCLEHRRLYPRNKVSA